MTAKIVVSIDPAQCLGTGSCEYLDPERFVLDDSGVARFRDEAAPESLEWLENVSSHCPQGAITVTGSEGSRDGS